MLQPRQNSPSTRGGKTGVKTSSLNTVGVGSGADADVDIGVGADIVVGGALEEAPRPSLPLLPLLGEEGVGTRDSVHA